MQFSAERWEELRRAVELDDSERFQKLVQEAARIAVAIERGHAIQTDRVKRFEWRGRPFLITER